MNKIKYSFRYNAQVVNITPVNNLNNLLIKPKKSEATDFGLIRTY